MTPHSAPMPLSRLLAEAGIPVPPLVEGITVSCISTDSRTLSAGDLFIALTGFHTDARRYITEADRKSVV